jgi:recyclin-1
MNGAKKAEQPRVGQRGALSKSSKTGPARISSPMYLASLHSTTMLDTKPFLPAEILTMILDYLPIPDLLHFARSSKRMQEMVYEDTRWVQKLKLMSCWNEAEARQRVEDALKRKLEVQKPRESGNGSRSGHGRQSSMNGTLEAIQHPPLPTRQASITLFDQGWEEQRDQRYPVIRPPDASQMDNDGFSDTPLTPYHQQGASIQHVDHQASLTAIKRARSIRGYARQEFGKVYAALAPFYNDLVRSRSHTDPVVFRVYTDPEQQAQMLMQLRAFGKADITEGWSQRDDTLESMIGIFENAVLREFEQGYESNDVQGRMRKYAHVLVALNGGAAAVDLYIHNHHIMLEKDKLGDPLACLTDSSSGTANLLAVHNYFQRLSLAFNEESGRIEQVFPPTIDVQLPLLDRAADEIVSEYVTTLFDEAHTISMDIYLKVVAAVYQQCLQFADSLRPAAGSQFADFHVKVMEILNRCFEPHIDLFLQEELDYFKSKCRSQVQTWEKQLSEQEASAETFFMSNISRSAAKRDFMASFKAVVMLPVNAVQTIPRPAFATSKSIASAEPSRPTTPALNGDVTIQAHELYSSQRAPAPTTELAAKAALMNSKLEGISTLFSLEVALSLVHAAKASIERAGLFVKLGGQSGEEAKEQCQAIFVDLLQILGFRHIKPGFDKAVGHLSVYNAREVSEHNESGVRPLVTFLELVNVGDLIQQMVDVFYAQELVATKLSDRDDFLDPAVKEKKRFEQMLDERVAAGLNKGIDVLMDEVEYVCATTQLPSDYNPGAPGVTEKMMVFDIGASTTATKVVELVSSHTNMLVGSADKNMLDVFNQEVGLRLFTALSKHLKRQRISNDGAIKLISDTNHYFAYIQTLRNKELLQYFRALREVSQIFLIDGKHAKEIAAIVADADRYSGIFRAEEVLEFAERRADWYMIKGNVEKAMYGFGCLMM